MTSLFLPVCAALFVVIDPLGAAPIFASLTTTATPRYRRTMAIRSVLVAGGILFIFALLGAQLLHAVGISLAAFRIAGGATLFLVALEMIFDKTNQRREEHTQHAASHPEDRDISVFPMAIPMIAGPGSIASAMLLTAQSPGWAGRAAVLAALASVLAFTLLTLLAADPLMRIAGPKTEAMLTRVLGVILSALAVQFVIDGIHASLS